MFGKKKQAVTEQFDKEKFRAVLRCSICTGEQVAGFKDIHTGEFHDVIFGYNNLENTNFGMTEKGHISNDNRNGKHNLCYNISIAFAV